MPSDLPSRLALVERLWRRGFPAAALTPSGLRPVVVVWVDEPEDPALEPLRRAFGGRLKRDMGYHHGEISPAFWFGVGRSAALAAATLRAAPVGVRAAPAEVLWRDADALWRRSEALEATLLRPAHRTPSEDADEAAAPLADALMTELRAVLSVGHHITVGLLTAAAEELRTGALAGELAMPSRAERDAWVAAFWAAGRAAGGQPR